MRARKGNWTRSFSKRVMLLADPRTNMLGYKLLDEQTPVRCMAGCFNRAKEQWLVPDVNHPDYARCKAGNLRAPAMLFNTCGPCSKMRKATHDDRVFSRNRARNAANEARWAGQRHADRLREQLKGLAVVLPPGISDIWPDVVYRCYAAATRHDGTGAYELGALRNGLAKYFASLTETERTLLALTTALPTEKE